MPISKNEADLIGRAIYQKDNDGVRQCRAGDAVYDLDWWHQSSVTESAKEHYKLAAVLAYLVIESLCRGDKANGFSPRFELGDGFMRPDLAVVRTWLEAEMIEPILNSEGRIEFFRLTPSGINYLSED